MRTFVTVIENFVLFSTLLAIATFALAYVVRLAAALRGWRPFTLTRFYTASLALWTSVSSYVRVSRIIARLEMDAEPPPLSQVVLVQEIASRHRLDVGLVMSHFLLSFDWGYRKPKLILSSGLLNTLTPEEILGVLEHEAAHYVRRDNLMKLMLSLCGYASVAFPLSLLILRWRNEQVELACDEVAVAKTNSPLEIADALVKVRRNAALRACTLPQTSSSGFTPDDETSVLNGVCAGLSLLQMSLFH